MKKKFINFSGSIDQLDPSLAQRQKLLNITAKKFANIDESIAWNRDDLVKTEYYQYNKYILDSPRGAGYWAWKPYIILETLKQSDANDWVIYCDAGKPFRRGNLDRSGNENIGNTFFTPVDALIEFAKENHGFTPGIWIPHYGLAHIWTKRDCFVGMDCDTPEYHNSPHVQAGYSVWSKSEQSLSFLNEWLEWCCKPEIISDDTNIYGKPNLPNFRDHRHDQSILSNLVVKHKINLFGPKEYSLNGYRNFNLIIRYMMLEQSKKSARKKLASLFETKKPQLPSYLKELVELLFLTEIKENSKILIQEDLDIALWQKSLPNTKIEILKTNNAIDPPETQYEGIFISHASVHHLDSVFFSQLYSALKPGGFLTFGPFQGSKTDSAKTSGTFSEFINWIDQHQRLPEGFGATSDQQVNALTSGSIVNPMISRSNQGKVCHVCLCKPKIYLLDHI